MSSSQERQQQVQQGLWTMAGRAEGAGQSSTPGGGTEDGDGGDGGSTAATSTTTTNSTTINRKSNVDPHNNGARAALTNEIRSEFFRLYGEYLNLSCNIKCIYLLVSLAQELFCVSQPGLVRPFTSYTCLPPCL